MNVEKVLIRKERTSCNFCDKGKLNALGSGLVYPYESVFMFSRSNGNGVKPSICDECLSELVEKTANYKADKCPLCGDKLYSFTQTPCGDHPELERECFECENNECNYTIET